MMNIYLLMSQYQSKQVKLNQVCNQLSTIKQQLQQLMQPKNNRDINAPLVKINIMQSVSEQILKKNVIKHAEQTANRKKIRQVMSGDEEQRQDGSNRECLKIRKLPMEGNFRLKEKDNHYRSITSGEVGNAAKGQAILRTEQRLRNELKCMPKIQFSPPKKQIKQKHRGSPTKQPPNPKKYTHGRHATYCQTSSNQFQNNNNPPALKCNNFNPIMTHDRQTSPKQQFTFNKNNEPNKEKGKRLKRMRSDFTGVQEQQPMRINISDKVRELQDELNRKDEAIEMLYGELHQIQKNFAELESVLGKILSQQNNSPRSKQFNLKQALKEVFRDMKVQSEELTRINVQCQRLRKLNLNQQKKLLQLEGGSRNYQNIDQIITKHKDQIERYRREGEVIGRKLEVSVSQNRLKDQFIVKFITSKNDDNIQKNSQWIREVLQAYLKTCNYPQNKLLQKLQQQQQQIQKLRFLLTKKQ